MFKCKINRHSGFTLIELVVVILLLGILSVFAMGRMFDGNQFKARGFFDDTVTAVRFAQKLAVSTGCAVQVDLKATGYELDQRATDCTTGSFTRAVANPANRSNPYENDKTAGLSVPSATIVFDARGLADGDINVPITMTAPGGVSYIFQVSSDTGLVSVFP